VPGLALSNFTEEVTAVSTHERWESEKITIRWPHQTGLYRAEYPPSMTPPHRSIELINALASLPGVISVRTMNNNKGLYINAATRNTSLGRYVYNQVYGVFKRLGYELVEDESQEGSE
jgi:hypothetical protein